MSSVENWLTDEQFDFDVTASPVWDKNDGCLVNSPSKDDIEDEDEDEEVFFGPQTHKERIAAVVVKEQEFKHMPLESLTAEQQALLLRETALLSVRIKHGTPGNAKASPVAVVHPMPRNNECFTTANKENDIPQLDDLQKLKLSQVKSPKNMTAGTKQFPSKLQLLQPKFGLNKGRPSSQPETSSSTKLPVTKLRRAKVQSEMSEPLVDKVSLYGLDKTQTKSSTKTTRRKSGLPVTKKSESTFVKKPQQQTHQAPPSLLKAAFPTSRLRAPASKSMSDVKLPSKGPMRATTFQSSLSAALSSSGVPRPNLRVPSSSTRKSVASTGTPSKGSGIPSSARRRSKIPGTPSRTATTTSTARPAEQRQHQQAQRSSLTTPVQRTPSSRRQMTARQLMIVSKTKDTDVSPKLQTKDTTQTSTTSLESEFSNEKVGKTSAAVTPQEESSPQMFGEEATKVRKEQSPSLLEEPLNVQETAVQSTRGKCEENQTNTNDIHGVSLSKDDSSPQPQQQQQQQKPFVISEDNSDEIDNSNVVKKASSPTVLSSTSKADSCDETIRTKVPEMPLLVLADVNSPLVNMISPVKKNMDLFLDPFQTGATPPPLIDVMDVLEPERPAEQNLIEF